MTEACQPSPASSVILLRPDENGGFEVFMTRRPQEMKFMGGCYVFPGGSVEEDDWTEEMLSRCRGLSPGVAQNILGSRLTPELSLAHWVAGIRELFEEAGVLFSVKEDGGLLDAGKQDLQRRLAEKRQALVGGQLSFNSLLESEGLYCDVSRPVYFSHRVTPEKHAIRFDTRFFLARLPEDQTPLFSSQEVTESLWITPEKALQETGNGLLPLMPPTVAMLRNLAVHASWEHLCVSYRLG